MEPASSDWKNRIIFSPEDAILFNSSRLLLLFESLNESGTRPAIGLERLCYYDFFAANPFLVVDKEDPMWLELEIEGFEPNKLEYISTPQRFRTKRESIKQYICLLVSKGLIKVEIKGGKILYEITSRGIQTARKTNSLYAMAYRKSASFVINKLKNFSDKKLWENASNWLEAKSFRVDLYDLVEDINDENQD